ncbi:restriction endonuclease subunit S, partial [Halomonas sp. AOP43-D1-39]|uniref:restriction endonuclease subunit S n=2 Tax=unclassified Halomonas TaxID=2609666 RepID=UPI004034A053
TKSKMNPAEMIKTSSEIHLSYKKTTLVQNEIVLALRGEVGLARMIEKELSGTNITRGLARLSAKKSEVIPEFLIWVLRSPKFRTDLIRRVGGSALQEISLSELRKVEALIPPLPEQKKIAQILSTWDQAITATERLLGNSLQRKKGLMQQLLMGKKRLISDNGTQFSGDWKERSIEEFFSVGSSKRVLQKDWKTKGIPFYRTRELVSLSKNQRFSSEIFISEELYSELSQKHGAPSVGDFLVSGVGTLGICYRVKEGDQFYFKDGNVIWFRPKKGIDSHFFEYCFQHEHVQSQIVSQASITTVGTYTIQNARKTKFYCPPTINEQKKVASIFLTVDREIDCIHMRLSQLKKEKKALMQKLLTGKRRVQVEAA